MLSNQPPSIQFRFKSKPEVTLPECPRPRSKSPSPPWPRKNRHRRPRSPTSNTRVDSRSSSAFRARSISPDTAFKESLFDALADDEGAAYWESVYGQPIHIYPRRGASLEGHDDLQPEPDRDGNSFLDKMNDDEYANYVRARMWENSHSHIKQERTRRQEAKRRRIDAEQRRDRRQGDLKRKGIWCGAFDRAADKRRAQDRRSKLVTAWMGYCRSWERLEKYQKWEGLHGSDPSSLSFQKTTIPWPTLSGRCQDISQETVEDFFRQSCSEAMGSNDGIELDKSRLLTTIKKERIKWHPDKMRQRFGVSMIDEDTTRKITAVFQILDRFYDGLKGH